MAAKRAQEIDVVEPLLGQAEVLDQRSVPRRPWAYSKVVVAMALTASALAFCASAAAGVSLVRDIDPGSGGSVPSGLERVGNVLFFSADDVDHGRELWKSDGTELGTTLVRDITSVQGSTNFGEIEGVGRGAFFSACLSGSSCNRSRLWASDSSAPGTAPFVTPRNPGELTAFDSLLFFVNRIGIRNSLWRSDGTEAGTQKIKGGPSAGDLTPVGDSLFFTSNQNPLWVTDGTTGGTVLVRRWGDGPFGSTFLFNFTDVGGRLFFTVDSTHRYGTELWTSDGTKAGTVLVKDIASGAGELRS